MLHIYRLRKDLVLMKEFYLEFTIYDRVHDCICTEIADVGAYSIADAVVRFSKYIPSYAYIISVNERF
jgi:hypothetical protein